MSPAEKYLELPDLSLAYYEWGNPENPTILFFHATGMHGRVWDKTIEALPANLHVIAVDQRGHGRSICSDYLLDWRVMGKDASDVLLALDLNDVMGVGHSMGGHSLLQAALTHPQRFRNLLLIDPVIFPPERYDQKSDFESGHPEDNPIARRRNQFDDWQDMYAKFKDREPYCRWTPEILENYCRYGLVAHPTAEGYTLACPPAVEASVYMGHCSVNLHQKIPSLEIPTTVFRAKDPDPDIQHKIDFSASPTWEKLAGQFPNGRDIPLKHLTHFIPMQEPTLVSDYIKAELV